MSEHYKPTRLGMMLSCGISGGLVGTSIVMWVFKGPLPALPLMGMAIFILVMWIGTMIYFMGRRA